MKRTLLASAVALGFAAASANAAPVGGLFSGVTVLSDNSAEIFIDQNGDGKINVGDIFITILGLNSIEGTGTGSTAIGSGTAFSELTAITAAKIATDVPLIVNSQGIAMHLYSAEALSAADAGVVNFAAGTIFGAAAFLPGCGLGVSNNSKDFACVFEDPSNDFTRDSTLVAGIGGATNGTPRMALQLDPAKGDSLAVIAPGALTDPAFLALPGGTQVALSAISFDGTISANTFGFGLDPQITGGAGGFAKPISGEFSIWDNLDFTVRRVPEPSSIALLGLALGGLGFASRRKQKS